MAKITIDTNNLRSPEALGFIISQYLFDADNILNLKWNEMPTEAKLYFNYLDVEQRKKIRCMFCTDTYVFAAEYDGDRFVYDGTRGAGSPMFYEDNSWIFSEGCESLRFQLDLERIFYEGEDPEDWNEDDFD